MARNRGIRHDHTPGGLTNRAARRGVRSSLGKQSYLRPRYETLEARHLLAADILGLPEPAIEPSTPAPAPITWFERFEQVDRIKLERLANVDQLLPEGVAGPIAQAVGEWIVQLTDDATADVRRVAHVDQLLDHATHEFTIISGLGSPGLVLVRGQGLSRASIEASLTANEFVESFSLNQLIQGQVTTPNESDFAAGLLPGLTKINAEAAWDESIGSMSTVVGVVDSGIDPTHPDLYLNIWINQGEIPPEFLYDDDNKLVDIDGDGLITFYDLNNVTRSTEAPYPLIFGGWQNGPNAQFVRDLNNNGRIDADDLLKDALWTSGTDNDGNGFFDDIFGVNFRAGAGDPFASNNPTDELGHGTHVAGTIGAIGNNGTGVVGVNWQTSLMSLRILDNNNQGDSGAAIRAINYARDMRERLRINSANRVTEGANVKVLNNSWGQPGGYEASLEAAIEQLYGAGILFVAAAGNGNILGNGVDNDRTPFYPASYESPNVIAVAAADASDRLATFSNFGKTSVDILAPGVGIRSTLPGGGYQSANGTSMAAPHVAGTAALIWSALPEATVNEVKQAILSTATPIAQPNIVATGGRLNAAAAINADVFAPAARLISKQDITTIGGTHTEFTIEYSHRSGIDITSIGDDDIIVTRQWGPAEVLTATLSRPIAAEDITATTLKATYRVTAPGGTWDALDFGDYLISTQAGTVVTEVGARPIQSRDIGRFNVRITNDPSIAGHDPSVIYVDQFGDSLESGSLRSAIIAANAAFPSPRTIILQSGKYTIDIPAVIDPDSTFGTSLESLGIANPGGWTNATTGDFDIEGNLTIIGDISDDTVIDAQGLDRVFKVHPNASLRLERLTIQGGVSPANQGGGGILSAGELNLHGVIARGNTALGPDETNPIFGGAIAAWGGSASLNETWLTENEADYGGGIYYSGDATGSTQRSTLSDNKGGGLDSRSSSDLSVANSTFSANVGGRGVIVNQSGTLVANGRSNFLSPASRASSISADGRYVTFLSGASNLVPGDTNDRDDIFLYDRDTSMIKRVSVSDSGVEANGDSFFHSISADGRYVTFQSSASNLVPGDTNGGLDIYVYDLTMSTIELVSITNAGVAGNDISYSPTISADGQFVMFVSRASNLVPGDDNDAEDIFIYDRNTSTMERVIVNDAGTQSIWYGRPPMLSADGRYVTFESDASNLVPGDTNGDFDIFVYDRDTSTINRVSISDSGVEANGDSFSPFISADGRYVTFQSNASNLVPGDTNGGSDGFIYDRNTNTIERVENYAGSLRITADGRYVTFSDFSHIYVHDRNTGTTERVSVSETGENGNSNSVSPSLSADGRYVTFTSNASNLVPGDINGFQDVFVYDRTTDTMEPVTFDAIGSVIDVSHVTITNSSGLSSGNVIRGDSRVENSLFVANQVVFDLDARAAAISTPNNNIFSDTPLSTPITSLQRIGNLPPVHRLVLGNPAIDATVTSENLEPDQLLQVRVEPADIGAVEATTASVQGIVYVDANRNGQLDADESGISGFDVVVASETTTSVIRSVGQDGELDLGELEPARYTLNVELDADLPWSVYVPPLELIRNGSVQGNFPLAASSLNADGRYVAFTSTSSNLVPGDNNAAGDVFVYDRNTGTIERVSVSDTGEEGNHWSSSPTLSADGRYVTFSSTATNLVPGDNNGQSDIFVYDRNTSTIKRVSVSEAGTEANSWSTSPAISADGRYVTFQSNASNLVPNDNNGEVDIFVYDLNRSTIERVSVSDAGVEGNARSDFAAISGDGRYVTFQSDASNLVSGDNNGGTLRGRDIFVYDRNTSSIKRVSVSNAGVEGTSGNSSAPAISVDGRFVTFSSSASNLVPGDSNRTSDIFVYDLDTNTIERVTLNNAGVEANSYSNSPRLSGDGRYIIFESNASNLVPGDNNGIEDLFVYDRTTNTIARVNVSDSGAEANARSYAASLSGDGQYLTFTSAASNLVAGDINSFSDVFITFNPLAEPRLTLDLRAGEIYSDLNFGLVPDPGTVSGRVFEDVVANGVYDQGEPVAINTQVFLDLNRNRSLDEGEPFTIPDADGRYEFVGIDSFTSYSVAAIIPSGYELITPSSNENSVWDIFLPAGGVITDRDFALRRIQSTGQSSNSGVSGRLFEDKDGDGAYSEGVDVPIVGFEVFLDAANFGVRDENEPRTLTDSQGRYSFDRLSARNVAVTTVLDETLVHVNPLGSKFGLETFPLFGAVTPFGNPQAIASGDFNQDGFLDVAVALGEANKLSIRLNDGNGGFLPEEIDVELGANGAGPTSLVVGQFDDDPRVDVALTANFSGYVTVLLNFDPTLKTFASTAYVKVGDEPLDIAAGDFTGDDKADLVVVNKADNTVQLLTNNGSGVFAAGPGVPTGGRNSGSIVVGNFTGDASLDVAVVHASPLTTATPFGGVTVLRGDGSGGLTRMPQYYTVGATPTDSVVGDFNGDGRPDIAISNFSSNSISILLGQADGTFRVQTAILGTASGAFDITVADIDNDGDVDVIASNLRDRNISIFRNIGVVGGEVQFEPLENIGLGQFSLAQRMPLVVGNFDNDTSGPGGTGTIDIVTIPQKTDTLHVLKNTLVNGAHRVALTGLNTITGRDFIIKPAILPPSFDVIANPLPIFEDAAQQSIAVSGIKKGRTTGPQLQFTATSSNPALIASPTVTYNGGTTATVQYTPLADVSGTTIITVRGVDAGADEVFGGADDGIFERSFTVSVLAVNDPPVFNLLAEASAKQTDGATTIPNFVTGMGNGGGPDEASQTREPLVVIASDPSFFSVQPAISAAGTLTFTPNPNKSGSVPVTVTLKDSGGRANGGVDTTTKTFLVIIGPVNDPPSFTLMANPNRNVLQTAGPQTVNDFVTSFSPGGGPNEATQTVSDYIVTVDAPGIFAVLPDINNNGTLTFTPAIDRTGLATVSVQVRDSGGRANGGNDLSAAQTFTILVMEAPDTTRPTPVLSTPGIDSLTNQTTFDVEVDFNEPLTAGSFTIGDMTVSKGTTSNFRDLGAGKYLIGYSSPSDGAVTFEIAASRATDLAGNQNLAATSLVRTIDSVGMTPTLDSTAALLSNADSFLVAIDFTEPATGFTLSDLVVLNGTASDLQPVDAPTGNYRVTVTPHADGNVTVLLPANAVTDAAGNGNLSAAPLVRSFDRVSPVAVLSTDQPSTTNKTNFDVIVEFSEAVSAPVTSNLIVTGGTAGDPVAMSAGRYRYPITATGTAVTIQMAAGAVTDLAGNSNPASNTIHLTIDSSTFVPSLSSTSASTLSTLSFPMSVDFGKAVAGFALGDITVLNGTASNLVPVTAATGKYSWTVTASGDGNVSVLIAAGVVEDTSLNRNSASSTLVRTIDRVAPRPTLTASVGALTNQPVFTLTVDFGENVSGFAMTDVVASGATLSNLEILGNGRFRMTATASDGPVAFNVPANAVTDDAGNASLAATPLALTVDTVGMTPTLSSSVATLSNVASFVVAIDFAEAVTGFTLADLTVLNGTASNLVTLNAATGKYNATITPVADGNVTVLLPANAVTDAAGNGNSAAVSLVRTIDRTAPAAVLTTNQPSPTNLTTFEIIAEFGEAVTDFTSSDVTVTGGSVGTPILLSPRRYSLPITTDTGSFSLRIAEGTVFDAAGNANTVSNTISLVIDTTAIVPQIATTAPSIVTSDSFDISIHFGKATTNFVAADILVTGGSVGELTEVDAVTGSYTATITPTVDGVVTVLVGPGATVDAAGNVSAASNVISRRFDRTAPSATLAFLASAPGQTSREVEIAFSEPVKDFDPSDLIVSGGTAGSLVRSVNQMIYSVLIIPTGDGELGVELPAGRVQDAAGLGNTPAVPITTFVDISRPVPTIAGVPSTVLGQFDITIAFSEAVTGLTANDLQIGNAILTDLAGSGSEYTARLTAITQGNVTISLPEERVIDAAGNRNTDSNELLLIYRFVDSIVLESSGETIDMSTHDETVLSTIKTIDIRGTGVNSLVLDAEKIARLTPDQTLLVISDRGDVITFDKGWTFDSVQVVDGAFQRIFRNGTARVHLVGPTEWTNPVQSTDVSGNGDVSAVDALRIINALNQKRVVDDAGVLVDATTVDPSLFAFYDVNGDSSLTALDALLVINELNRRDSITSSEPFSKLAPSDSVGGIDGTWMGSDLAVRKSNLPATPQVVEFGSEEERHVVSAGDQSINIQPKSLATDAPASIEEAESSDTYESIDHVLQSVHGWGDLDG